MAIIVAITTYQIYQIPLKFDMLCGLPPRSMCYITKVPTVVSAQVMGTVAILCQINSVSNKYCVKWRMTSLTLIVQNTSFYAVVSSQIFSEHSLGSWHVL